MNATDQATFKDVRTDAFDHWINLRALVALLQRAEQNAPEAESGETLQWREDLTAAASLIQNAEVEADMLFDQLESLVVPPDPERLAEAAQ